MENSLGEKQEMERKVLTEMNILCTVFQEVMVYFQKTLHRKVERGMQHIVIEVQDQEKAELLCEVLSALDFVTCITTDESQPENGYQKETPDRSEEFFSYAGLWTDRELTLTSIRQQAWPRQHQ
jgi:hypothetical protein